VDAVSAKDAVKFISVFCAKRVKLAVSANELVVGIPNG
jgi:hypothetical protein